MIRIFELMILTFLVPRKTGLVILVSTGDKKSKEATEKKRAEHGKFLLV